MSNIRNLNSSKTTGILAVLLSVGLLLSASHVQAQSMEERLRTQLRMTSQQLQALQSEQAQMQAARASAEAQRDGALENIKRLEVKLKRAQGKAEELVSQKDTIQTQVNESRKQVGAIKQVYDDLLVVSRNTESERASLQARLVERDQALGACITKNEQMYEVGKDMLEALEQVSTVNLLKLRQPFASTGRVKFEEMVQVFGDKLYSKQILARDPSAEIDR